MSTKTRILEFLEAKGLNNREFYSAVGLSNGYLDKVENLGSDKIERIIYKYPELNVEWLILGTGSMFKKIAPNPAPNPAPNGNYDQNKPGAMEIVLKENDAGKNYGKVSTMPKVITVDSRGEENVIYVPVKARAGYLTGYGDAHFIEKLPAYRVPGLNNGSYRIFEVDGNSMFNTLADGDKVASRWQMLSEIRDDRVYILVTNNDGIIIKRLINRYEEGKIIAKSDNNHKGEYPDLLIDIHEIAEVWYVVERYTRQMSRPGEIYKRVVDLEGDMAMMKDLVKKLNQGGLNKA